jgi:DNA-binding NarL/FixJ family response regulator
MRTPGKLKWEGGRLILEIDATIRVPVDLETITRDAQPDFPYLTRREQQTLAALVKGAGNKEIASALNISERTVKFHVSSLLLKFKVRSRGELQHLLGKNGSGDPHV